MHRFRFLLAGTAVLFPACFGILEGDKVAGNGSEVENAVVAGRVIVSSASGISASAPGADVAIYPSAFDALNDKANPFLPARTDTSGNYRLRAPEGTYCLWGHRPSDGLRFLIQDLQVASEGKTIAGDAILRIPGRLRVTLPEGSEGGYVFIPGTPVAILVDGASDSTGAMLLDSIPACRLKAVVLGRRGKPNLDRVLGTDVAVFPGATTNLPFTDWTHSASVRVNAGGALAKRVANIPLLFRLTAANFDFSQARGDGADIRFTKEDGTILPVQVQSWDSTGGSAAVWVRLDTVFADTAAHRIKMHWGNPRASAFAGAVFDSADGYVGAWHLDAKPSGTPLIFPDAGEAGDAALAMGALASPDSMPPIGTADGRIGAGIPLNGKDAYLKSGKQYAGPAEFTVSFWFRTTTKEGGKMAGFLMPGLNVSYGGKAGDFNFDRVVWMTDEGLLHAGFTMRSTNYPTVVGTWQSFTAAKPYNDGVWHHLAYTLWDAGALLAVDGIKVAGYTGLVRPLPDKGEWRVGYCGEGKWDPAWTSEYFQGSVDEVRLLHQSRSEDWLRLDYEAQKPDSKLLALEK